MERREQTRYRMAAEVTFTWLDSDGTNAKSSGRTRDISSKGMFIYSNVQPPEKADVQLELAFRPTKETQEFAMHVDGRVVRVEPSGRSGLQAGFAVLNRKYSLYNHVTSR